MNNSPNRYAMVIYPDSSIDHIHCEDPMWSNNLSEGGFPFFSIMKQWLGLDSSDLIEHVPVYPLQQEAGTVSPQRADMFVDEEGLLRELPFNPIASHIYWTASLWEGRSTILDLVMERRWIYGPAIIFYNCSDVRLLYNCHYS